MWHPKTLTKFKRFNLGNNNCFQVIIANLGTELKFKSDYCYKNYGVKNWVKNNADKLTGNSNWCINLLTAQSILYYLKTSKIHEH